MTKEELFFVKVCLIIVLLCGACTVYLSVTAKPLHDFGRCLRSEIVKSDLTLLPMPVSDEENLWHASMDYHICKQWEFPYKSQ